jgi:hypothetical protein
MRKSFSQSSPSESIERKLKQTLSLSSKERLESFIAIPEIFYVNTEKRTEKKRRETAKQRISVLAEFGFIPDTLSNSSSKLNTPKLTKNSIKISDFMGKNNTQKIFKSLDLPETFEKSLKLFPVEETRKFHGNLLKKSSKITELKKKTGNPDICRNIETSNAYQNLSKHKKSLKKIDFIYKSCDNLLYQSKVNLKSILSVRGDLQAKRLV